MATTILDAIPNTLRLELERVVDPVDSSASQPLVQAMSSFLSAMAYDDVTLLRSSMSESLEAFRAAIREDIERRTGWPEVACQACRKVRESLKDVVSEDFDDVGKGIESALNKMLNSLLGLRDGSVRMLTEKGYVIENASQLDCIINEIQKVKSGILDNWPWSWDIEFPPLDRKMVAESRAAIKRGEGERIEDLIRRLGGIPSKDS